MKISETYGALPSQDEVREMTIDERQTPREFADALLARRLGPDEAAELIIDAYEEGIFDWEQASQVALLVRV